MSKTSEDQELNDHQEKSSQEKCNHCFIYDLIDIDLDRSITIYYCKYCEYIPKSTYDA